MSIEARMTELEIRYSYQQQTIEQLSDVIARQQREIDTLRREVDALQKKADAQQPFVPHEKPPHY